MAFLGDGINDVPSILTANVGIAMGVISSDCPMWSGISNMWVAIVVDVSISLVAIIHSTYRLESLIKIELRFRDGSYGNSRNQSKDSIKIFIHFCEVDICFINNGGIRWINRFIISPGCGICNGI